MVWLVLIDPLQEEVNLQQIFTKYELIIRFSSIGLVGKIERATHIDINRDGFIGGRPGCYPPAHGHKKH